MFVGPEERMLTPLVWLHLAVYRPALLPERRVTDVVREVEELAGHVAALLEADNTGPSPTRAAAEHVLDECCRFVERWTLCRTAGRSFAGDLRRLRLWLDAVAANIAPDDLELDLKAS